MIELIDKSAVVVEIERLLAFYLKEIENNKEDPWAMDIAKRDILQEILTFLDTLEVKEVDLEKEIDTLWCSLFTNNTMKRDPTNPHIFIPVPAYTKDGAKIAYTLEIDWKIDEIDIDADFLMKFARHFFELGLKTKKGGRE